jgi:guanosine-3',5'-bis(diphosphate) 3'-pyrophosphohydrolase
MGLSRYEKQKREREHAQAKAVTDARAVATAAYQNVEYGPDMPYFEHCRRVASHVAVFGWQFEVVALLHDVVEDGRVTQADIDNYFDGEISQAVAAISRLPGELYSVYIKRVKSNQIARIVKIADIEENLFWGMGRKLPDKAFTLRPRYLTALAELLE